MLTMYKVRFGPDSIESENLSEIRQNLTTNLAVTDPAQSPPITCKMNCFIMTL